MNTQNTAIIHYVAIDVSKATLQVKDDKRAFTVENNSIGHRKLLVHLKGCPGPLVVYEASGGCERELAAFLRKSAIPQAMLNPARVRDFARSEAVRAKTDPIDTRMILAFAKSIALEAIDPPSQESLDLAALLDRREHLVEQMAREKNRFQNSEALILRSIKRMMKSLEKEIAVIDKAISQLVDSTPLLKSRSQTMQSVKGAGKVTA